MDADRSHWGAQEYADALNQASAPADVFVLVDEVNEKWSEDGAQDPPEPSRSRRRRILPDGDFGIASRNTTSEMRL
jgi:hypothetical protein